MFGWMEFFWVDSYDSTPVFFEICAGGYGDWWDFLIGGCQRRRFKF